MCYTLHDSVRFACRKSYRFDLQLDRIRRILLTVSDELCSFQSDEATQFYIKSLLEMKGIANIVAENGNKALQLLEEDEFDCILMDVQMPVLDGIEATKQIRSSKDNFKNIPIIALTAYAMSGDREKFMDAGMDDYIAKPVDQDELIQVLERNLSGAKS